MTLSRVFRDKYNIVYTDGTFSEWHMLKVSTLGGLYYLTCVCTKLQNIHMENISTDYYFDFLIQEVPCPVSQGDSKLEIEEALKKPGELYSDYDEAKKRLSTAFSQRRRHRRKIETRLDRQLQELSNSSIGFTTYPWEIKSENGGDDYFGTVGVAVFDEYAVLKVGSFIQYDEGMMLEAWNDLTNEAEAKGVTNLIIDIIGNGGGTIKLGYQLVQLMYPNANWRDLANPYDILDSPSLNVYKDQVRPMLDNIEQMIYDVDSFGNLQSITDDLNDDPGKYENNKNL